MALPNTSTVTPVFITDVPDFGKDIQVVNTYRTTVFQARKGGEQRARRRSKPRYSITYQLTDLNVAEFTVRKSKSLIELTSPVVVPIWTHYYALDEMTDADTAEFAIALARKKFKAGSYAYFVEDALVSTFRPITAVGATALTLSASGHFPSGTLPEFTSAARVYPCILGYRNDQSAGFTPSRLDRTQEQIAVEEL